MNSLLTEAELSNINFDEDHITITIDLSKELRNDLVSCDEIISFCNKFLENKKIKEANPLQLIFSTILVIFNNIKSEYSFVSSKINLSISRKCDCYTITRGTSVCYIGGDGKKHCTCQTDWCH